jgi:hypothetical protein
MTAEHDRLEEARERAVPWKKWGPYLSERQWGTVREDYSEGGDAWNYFSHDQARSRAYLFAAVSLARGLLDTFAAGLPDQSETYRFGRGMTYTLMNTFGTRMAAVFMFVTSSIGIRTAVLARWVSLVGFALGLVLLLVITEFAWIALVFPLWVLLVSTYILSSDFQTKRETRTSVVPLSPRDGVDRDRTD